MEGIEARYLPPILQEIAASAGLPRTLDLLKSYGGVRLYVPVKFDPDHPLVKLLGHAAAADMIQKYGRTYLDIPRGLIAIKALRDKNIRAERREFNQAQLALRWSLTERQIRNILGPEPVDDRQIGMF